MAANVPHVFVKIICPHLEVSYFNITVALIFVNFGNSLTTLGFHWLQVSILMLGPPVININLSMPNTTVLHFSRLSYTSLFSKSRATKFSAGTPAVIVMSDMESCMRQGLGICKGKHDNSHCEFLAKTPFSCVNSDARSFFPDFHSSLTSDHLCLWPILCFRWLQHTHTVAPKALGVTVLEWFIPPTRL